MIYSIVGVEFREMLKFGRENTEEREWDRGYLVRQTIIAIEKMREI